MPENKKGRTRRDAYICTPLVHFNSDAAKEGTTPVFNMNATTLPLRKFCVHLYIHLFLL